MDTRTHEVAFCKAVSWLGQARRTKNPGYAAHGGCDFEHCHWAADTLLDLLSALGCDYYALRNAATIAVDYQYDEYGQPYVDGNY